MLKRPRYLWFGYDLTSPAVLRKIEWAEGHQSALKAAIDEFSARDPFQVSEDRRTHDGKADRVRRHTGPTLGTRVAS